ncbi:MAG: FAD-dependent oxidoreductase, partial [Clostridia bacterium]
QLFGRTYVSRSKKHNIPGVRMLNKKEIDAIEPNTRSWAVGALYAPTTGAVSPYKLTIAYAENACQNGAIVSFDTIVTDIVRNGDEIIKVTTNRGEIIPKVVINCAGVFADKIAEMAGDKFYSIHPRKGTDLIMDGKVSNQIAHNSISRAPTLKMLMGENRNTKGGGIVVTVDGNILIGPDAVETPLCEDISTTAENIKKVIAKQQNITDGLRQSDVIAYFSGVRAANYEEDFIIEPSKKVRNFVHAACIQSPGLTASPAIGEDVAKMAVDILKKQQIVEYNSNFNPNRKDIPHLKKMSDKERDLLIKSNADYGKILCRCEEVSLGEIKDAIHSNPPALTVDAVKRRVRAGMGRCQGGFCQPLVMQTLAEELNIDETQVRKGDIGSNLAVGYNKDIYIEQ